MKILRLVLLLSVSATIALLAACGSSHSTPPAIVVTFTPGFTPPTTMNTNSQAGIAATVTNDGNNAGVTWTVTCNTGASRAPGVPPPCGSFNPTSTASTIPTTYTAPASIPTGNTVTVTATSVTDSSKSASAVITIATGGAISVSFNPPAQAAVNINATALFTAVVQNDSANAGVTWSLACGAVNGSIGLCGQVAPGTTDSGVPTTYTAPNSNPGPITITATSVTDTTKSASATITITSAATSLNDGTYVFQLSGTDFTEANGTSNYYVAGAFIVSAGAITGGEQDFVDFSGIATDAIFEDSTIQTTADGNLQIILDTQDPTLGVNGFETINATLVSSSRALISQSDSFATATGTIDLQTSTAPLSGGYAFFASGLDIDFLPLAVGGVLRVDGPGSISGNGSVFDLNDAFLPFFAVDQGFAPSLVSAPDELGRVEFNLFPSDISGVTDITFIGYIVDGHTIQLVEGTDDLVGTMGGTALSQGAGTGNFGTGSLSGLSYVAGTQGEDTNGAFQLAGTLTFNSNLSLGGNVTFNDLFSQVSGDITAGTYTVDSTGRVTVTGLSGSGFGPASLQLYLDGSGNALAMSLDNTDVIAGPAIQQSAGGSFSGSYALNGGLLTPDSGYLPWSAVGPVFTADDGTITGFTDFNVLTGPLAPNVQLAGSSGGSGGVLTGDLIGLNTDGVTQDTFTYYVVDSNRLFGIETDDVQLGLTFLEGVSPCANCAKKTKAKH